MGKGLNVTRDHIVAGSRPNICIEDSGPGSHIVWTVACTPRIAGLSGVFESRLQSVYTRLAAALAQEAERR